MKVSIIIPCYNEEERISETLEKIKNYVEKSDLDFEIIVIDDGSSDKTLEEVGKSDLDLKIIQNEKNSGKGFSVRRGILESTGDFSLFMDADSSTEIIELDKFIPHFETHDIVLGSRGLTKDSVVVSQGFIRRNIGKMAHKLIHLILNTEVKDTMCGFKAFNKKSREKLFSKQINTGWGFDYEIIFLAEKSKFKIKEVPISWRDAEGSKVTVKGYLDSLRELFMIRLNHLRGKYS